MSSHPAIPPKSGTIWKHPGKNGLWMANGGDQRFWTACESDREIVAPYFETRWRKRAERWEKVFERYEEMLQWERRPWLYMPWGKKLEVALKTSEECERNALAWRAWGEKK